ncbi:IQ domain-containing protein IQM2-like [Mangifera indica]|uniref:IQ domain-containing protein IQM2-like n=1 Tax=Mangifera indica TaxID=29780 RepID=UPI001CFB82A8|nr:IQ domain-containing protein IQM2-like [Mangifera indica]
MGINISCPFAEYSDVESGLESVIVKSISFGDKEVKTPVRSISFKSEDMEPTILKSVGAGKMMKEGSVSFKESELEAMISLTSSFTDKEKEESIKLIKEKSSEMDNYSPRSDNSVETVRQLPVLDPCNPKHQAAIKLQKVYKSFRTRRKLADCAVLVEQSWWKLLDFAELKRSSISFFDIEKHETAISRWSRAKSRAAKVGKGLSKNDKAQKLALQHWLEAIDPRHRYGHNLHFYYEKWLHSKSREPFFYWLDIGEGREVNLVEKCPRSKLQTQCIKYLGPMERKAYEVHIKDGKFYFKQTGEILNTFDDSNAKWIFVLGTSKTLYVGKKKKGTFQHSSFLAGGATLAAGRLVVENGELKAVWPHSGHYRPTEENFKDFISFLEENNVDITNVQMSPVDEGESSDDKQRSSMHIRNHSSEEDLTQVFDGLKTDETNVEELSEGKTDSVENTTTALSELPKLESFNNFSRKLASLEIPRTNQLFEKVEDDYSAPEPSSNKLSAEPPVAHSHSTEEDTAASEQNRMEPMQNQSDEEPIEAVPQEVILQRINSRKGMKSYQLGKQLSFKWTTGAGPRIGCVRDYPSELQFRALEKVNLSPRSAAYFRSNLCFSTNNWGGISSNRRSPMGPGGKLEATVSLAVPEK